MLLTISAAFALWIVYTPKFPAVDSAFFEYVGRSIANGAHLYTDIWDNKLPSIYLINALWWKWFADNYVEHLVAESLVNAVTIGLFAAIAWRFGVRPWATATFVFTVFYLFVGGPPNQTEHYATPLIFAAILLSTAEQYAGAGILLALASTFWVPSFLAGATPIFIAARPHKRIVFLVSLLVSAIVLVSVFVAYYGRSTATELVRSWVSYEIGNYRDTNSQSAHHHYLIPLFSPSYYLQSGLGILLFALAAVVRRQPNRTARFGLVWTASTLLLVCAMGKPSVNYFLPLYGPMIFTVFSQQLSLKQLRQRWYFTGATALFFVVTCAVVTHDIFRSPKVALGTIIYAGSAIRETYGPGAVGMLPWEAYLTSYAVPPGRFYIARGWVAFAAKRDTWKRRPQVYVDDAEHSFNKMPPPRNLHEMCHDALTGRLSIYSEVPIHGMPCVRV